MKRVLMVCLGNICRSPTAEGALRALIEHHGLTGQLEVDSAGTAAWHAGKAPDPRTQQHAGRRGLDLSGLRARQVQIEDFYQFDYLLAMDASNLAELQAMAPADGRARLQLLLDYGSHSQSDRREVPDPYYGGEQGFEEVLDLVQDACEGLLKHLRQSLNRAHTL